jgi:hypothetical protein
MPNVAKLLSDLRSRGAEIQLDGRSVKVTAAKGTIHPDQLAVLRDRKAEIITFLEAANDQPATPAEIKIPATIEPQSDEYRPFDWGTADAWTMKYRREPLRSADAESAA